MAILLDQLLEKTAFDREKEQVKKSGKKPISKSKEYRSLDLWDIAIRLAKDYSMKFPYPADDKRKITENELLGGLSAYIDFSDKEIEAYREHLFDMGNQKFFVDMVLRKGDDQIILEMKKTQKNVSELSLGEDQIFSYMIAAGINLGILLFVSDKPAKSVKEKLLKRTVGSKIFKVIKIFPAN